TSEARKALPQLVDEAVSRKRPAQRPRTNAVEIRPRGRERSASLVPTIDLDAAEARIDELEEELENAGIALFLQDRLAQTNGRRVSTEDFLRGIGMEEFVARLPGR
ncbi:MAG: hypothetical protein LC749_13185, partial [Actinobacteria bacterium]|nr:hypothetical protein [Actinomycetota bacterium]